ncbi:hypothetical protein FJ434_25930 [Mesorhizobium sp. B2-5-13]|nr:hypothetical protein FJ432_24895 [Mesorhizobium sp. B2-6-5]TPJ76530.1 hypothetical protein FJ434_25930 [Mesorhizobium sp. B2-5-13]TPK42721.1 hypothetical protein FJ560_25595 [Mesorhizobium sp. B2-5-5]
MFQLGNMLLATPHYTELSTDYFFRHPSSVSALRADPPAPTRGEGRGVTAREIGCDNGLATIAATAAAQYHQSIPFPRRLGLAALRQHLADGRA